LVIVAQLTVLPIKPVKMEYVLYIIYECIFIKLIFYQQVLPYFILQGALQVLFAETPVLAKFQPSNVSISEIAFQKIGN